MLVIKRDAQHPGFSISLPDGRAIHVDVRICGNAIKVAIDAPLSCRVRRDEVHWEEPDIAAQIACKIRRDEVTAKYTPDTPTLARDWPPAQPHCFVCLDSGELPLPHGKMPCPNCNAIAQQVAAADAKAREGRRVAAAALERISGGQP